MLGGGDGFACSWKAPQPACAQFLAYIDSPSVQRRIGSTSFGLPVRKGTESSVKDPNLRTVLKYRSTSPFIQLYLDIAYSQAIGQALDAAIADQFAGKATPGAGRQADRGLRQEEVGGDVPTHSRPAAPTRGRPCVGHDARWLEIGLFLAPALVLYVVFLIVPVVQAVHYSVYAWNGLGPLTDFVGLDNYREAFGDPGFREAMQHNVILVALSLAAAAAARPRGGAAPEPPAARPQPPAADLLRAVRALGGDHRRDLPPDPPARRPSSTRLLQSVGLGGLVQLWLADLGLVFYTLFVVITWKYIGFSILLFLAGLQGVPSELHEAAAMDGASSWETLRLRDAAPARDRRSGSAAFLAVIGSIQLFDIVWIMTLGGPAGASSTMATYMIDQGVNSYRIGYATSVAVILFAVCFVFSILYQFFVLRRDVARRDDADGRVSGAPSSGRAHGAVRATRRCTSWRSRSLRCRAGADRLRRPRRLPHDRPDRRRSGRASRSVGPAQLRRACSRRRRSGASSPTA